MTNISKRLYEEYKFHRRDSCGEFGYDAQHALRWTRAAMLLADLQAEDLVRVIWEHDADGDLDAPDQSDWSRRAIEEWNATEHTVETCSIETPDGEILDSLSGIWDADDSYRRFVEAELAYCCRRKLEEIRDKRDAGFKLEWYETSSAFYIVDVISKRERCMGDGVDMFTNEDGESIDVGTPEFYAALNEIMNDEETYEAYFG